MKRGTSTAWLRGAFSIALAYLLVLQLVLAGFAAERMALADGSGLGAICAPNGTTQDAAAPPGHDDPAGGQDHASYCAICAFHALGSLLPDRITPAAPAPMHARAPAPIPQRLATHGLDRRNPRSSQGPPRHT